MAKGKRNQPQKSANHDSLWAHAIAAGGDDLVSVVDEQGRFVHLGDMAREFLGAPAEDLLGKDIWGFIHPQDRAAAQEEFARRLKDKSAFISQENRLKARNGQERRVLWTFLPRFDEHGEPGEILAIARDLDGLKREAEQHGAQAPADDRLGILTAVLDAVEDVLYVADPDTYEILHVNEAFKKYWGEDNLGKVCYRVLQGRDEPCPFCTNHKIFGEYLGRTYVWEFQNEITGNWYRCTDRAIDWTDGRKVRFELASDITALKQTEQSLREHKESLQATVSERTAMLEQELRERQKAEEALRESESAVRKKLKAITEPEADVEILSLADVLDVETLRPMLEAFNRVTGVANAIIDIDGNVLVGVGWQDICTQFHRTHPQTLQNCIESDTILTTGIEPGESKAYFCKNKMWDLATPIILNGRHLGNLFIGQYFLTDTPPDREMFREMARAYGFDEEKYLAALDRVPRVDSGKIDSIMSFLAKFAGYISYTSVNTINLSRALEQRRRVEEALEAKSRVTEAINRVFREAITCDTEEQLSQSLLDVAEGLTGAAFGFVGEINAEGKLDTIGLSSPGYDACHIEGSNALALIKGMELRGIWATVLKDGAARIINDPSAHPDSVGVPSGHPKLFSFLGVPFSHGGRVPGMIALANKEGGFNRNDQEAVSALAPAFYEALLRKRLEIQIRDQGRIKAAQNELSSRMAGDPAMDSLCQAIITFLCDHLRAPTGLIYVADSQGTLRLAGSHAHRRQEGREYSCLPGEGLVGQAARSREVMILDDVPRAYFTIESGLGRMTPGCVFIMPVVNNQRVPAVLELGFISRPQGEALAFLEAVNGSIAVAVESAQARAMQAEMLEETQRMNEELQSQQDQLKAFNEELEEKTNRLQDSEAELRTQQEEMQATNEELQKKTELLKTQKQDVEDARRDIAEKAEELGRASKYKSEFLANMSHELRSPLNSLLLLSHSLAENKTGNMTEEQVESAKIIHQGGNELLTLINDILDLSKIEAGRMEFHFEEVPVADLAVAVERNFKEMAKQKGIGLEVTVEADAPRQIVSDQRRLDQVLKNLVSNAVKFTEAGKVSITFFPGQGDSLGIRVADTGIGIAPEQHKAIFAAFQQGDGSTARRYGGTGLGLSIVTQLLAALGGDIDLTSELGQGSTFTMHLPVQGAEAQRPARPEPEPPIPETLEEPPPPLFAPATIKDDRTEIQDGDRTILIVEDDIKFATVLARHCRKDGFKVLSAGTGEDGLELAKEYVPHGIILDVRLPGIDGWHVLDLLKDEPRTRHIPVHMASVEDPPAARMLKGAVGYMQKPLTAGHIDQALAKLREVSEKKRKRILVVDDEEGARKGIAKLLADRDVAVDQAATGAEALEALKKCRYECMVLDLGLGDLDGHALLKRIDKQPDIVMPPVIIHTGKELTWEEDLDLRSYASSVVVKSARSDERLLDEVSLFLHRVVADMPENKRQIITNLHDRDALLRGKTALLVDDDMRALFALTKILTDHGMNVLKADNGQKALGLLQEAHEVDIVLMDIMMPILDGYETMKRIRAQERFKALPILALTAKAMRGDREQCIKAGANDYLAKPIDQNRLLSMLRVWLYR